ncbi:MAG TPA: DUF3866 family protein [Firmicutes bacterium]|nr:DUF3866 family protein [Bacillota bacterium]
MDREKHKQYCANLEISLKKGLVKKILRQREGLEELSLEIDGCAQKGLSFPQLTGPAETGDEVWVNTTAVDLKLGSGGRHFIAANLSRPERKEVKKGGHIIKLRYTPLQLKVNTLEESFPEIFKEHDSIDGLPVIILELHSMLLPAVYTLKEALPGLKLTYIMTDGGALPLVLSEQVYYLKQEGLLDCTITVGHAFGGDLECVNIYTALLGAKHILGSDVAIIAMGPGIVGTGTVFGFTGIEQGENINRVGLLRGRAVTCPRISFLDSRSRHRGISHHSITSFSRVAHFPAEIALPVVDGERRSLLSRQLAEHNLPGIHKLTWHETGEITAGLSGLSFKVTSMGRTVSDDPYFFAAPAAAAKAVLNLIKDKKEERKC